MMLLIGMKISLTKNPTKPMMTNPVAVLDAIFQNSRESGLEHFFTRRIESLAKSRTGFTAMSATSIRLLLWVHFSSARGLMTTPTVASVSVDRVARRSVMTGSHSCSKCAGTGQVADRVDGFVTCVGCQGTGKDHATTCNVRGCERPRDDGEEGELVGRLRTDSVAAMLRELPMTSHDHGTRVPSVAFGSKGTGVALAYFCSDACGACKVFGPTLAAFLKEHEGEVECVAIACDAENSYERLTAVGCGMLRVSDGDDAEERARRVSTANAILRRCGVTMLPTLAVIDYKTGEVVTTWGRTALTVNPKGALRAWRRGESGLNPFGTLFKQFSESVTRCAYSGT